MKKKPKISVITVVYNNVTELQSTIDSVIEQTYPNIEFIIIDGGSTDGTLDIIERNNKFIDCWISEPDKGIYDAMNKGTQISSGDYIIFINSGDKFFHKEVLDNVINLSGCKNDVIYGDHWTLKSYKNDGHYKAKNLSKLKYGMICSHQSMLFKRKLLVGRGYSYNYGTAADYELLCYLYSKDASFFKLDDVIISYYQAGGVSDKKRIKSLCNSYKAYRDNLRSTFDIKFFYLWRLTMETGKLIFRWVKVKC
ncbi:MAG: glycosyltransferase [Candidatus Symbiopectobacterium sp. Dall1.0]|nr:glycosyltransferase [Candidatus Symbiopectobacterium sp. Dall1.0]